MTNIWVTGSLGQLGSEINDLKECFQKFDFFFSDIKDLDIVNYNEVEAFIKLNSISVIINCAAYTNVDGAEDEVDLANAVNCNAVKNLAKIAKKYHLKLVHISTDYVFDGNSKEPYLENAATNPTNVYGLSKLNGENELLRISPLNSIIIRTSWLYSIYGNNFVKTILRLSEEKEQLSVVNDQVGSPTYAKDLAMTILELIPLINNAKVQVYHYSNKGKCSWFEFAEEIVKHSKNKCKLVPVSSETFKSKATRPNFSLLNTKKIESESQITIPDWKESLSRCISRLLKNKN